MREGGKKELNVINKFYKEEMKVMHKCTCNTPDMKCTYECIEQQNEDMKKQLAIIELVLKPKRSETE